jgi:predicted SnoaL-like aldol condensation-catalyzing enzyme
MTGPGEAGRPPSAVDVAAHPDPVAALHHADPVLAANKRLVFDMWRSIVNAGHVELAETMLAEGYRQHSPVLPTGRDAFRQIFSVVPRQDIPELVSPSLVAIIAEGDLVVMALREGLTDATGQPYTSTHFNLFRVADGQLTEHWHSVQAPPPSDLPPPGQGGPWLVEGVTGAAQLPLFEATDPALAANKQLVLHAWREVIDGGWESAVPRLFAADYVEHDPRLPSGRPAVAARARALPDRPLADGIDASLVAVVAEGDLVTVVTGRTHPHPHRAGGTFTTTHFAMFRIQQGRIAEHWSGEAIPGGPAPTYGN